MKKTFLAGVLVVTSAAHAQPPRSEAMAKASIVFVGTVRAMGQVSFAGVSPSARTLVVRVDEVIEKPAAVTLARGQSVTVEVLDPSQFSAGARATFYAEGWILGAGVAVRELAHEPVTAATVPEKRAQLAAARGQVSDADLRARIQQAAMVVVGRVVSMQPWSAVTARSGATRVSEHDPDWQEAVIRVETGLKGARADEQVVVRFPKSMDVMWYGAPKFSQGQEGTFILMRDVVSGTPTARLAGGDVTAYTALEKADVLPRDAAERVRRLGER